MNTAIYARLFFSAMVACMLVGFTTAAQDKMTEKPKHEMKSEKAEGKKHQKHSEKAMKMKAAKEKKADKKADPQPK